MHHDTRRPSLKGTEKDMSPVSRYKAAPLHCHLQIQASHCESGRKTKERKKKGKRNWVIDKRASSGVGLRNVFITAQRGFEECFGVEKCVNCRVLDASLSRFFVLSTVITEYANSPAVCILHLNEWQEGWRVGSRFTLEAPGSPAAAREVFHRRLERHCGRCKGEGSVCGTSRDDRGG